MTRTEVEIKLRVEQPETLPPRIEALGARLLQQRELEDNQIFDFPDFALKTRNALLRVRSQASGATLTYKDSPRVEGGAKVRDEMEIGIEDGATMASILARLGMRPLFRYQKFRTVYGYSDLLITLDEVPIGHYIELEGPQSLIDEMAGRLGYKASDYIVKSYLALYQDHLQAMGLPLKDMLFDHA